MKRTLLAVAGVSLFALVGCEWPTDLDLGTGPTCGSACSAPGPTADPTEDEAPAGFTSVWVEIVTTGDTLGVDEHRLTVTHLDAFEFWDRLPMGGRQHLFRYSEENAANHHGEGPREATLATGATRCRVTSDNPQRFTVTYEEPTELTLRFTVAC